VDAEKYTRGRKVRRQCEMPETRVGCREEGESEVWERVELEPISVQRYLEELNELSRELAESRRDCGCGCEMRTTKERCRDIIREYYRRKGHATCECGRSVDESNDCRRDECKYSIPRRRYF
jgi:hypothetical protein